MSMRRAAFRSPVFACRRAIARQSGGHPLAPRPGELRNIRLNSNVASA